ncbi:hypothetical protein H6P81_002689 [Aristolochia fimbriata]|uniref:Reverse transcriptase domain-containing protein n=1 Tax=Aristolochia fimbriata TaxID=158543 RepID=A0AAV7FBM0_ARIFI|nr:hypothetical protein H6P81_002689 [Aristolochia fimbriata]
MLLMRKHNLPKVGLTPPYRKEQEDAHSSPQLANLEEELAVSCPPCITFREEDAQLGTKNHNRLLFISGYIRDHKINRILVDCGSAVNILPIRTMKNVGLSVGNHSLSSLLIQGFNQEGQRMLDMINLKLHIGDMVAETPFQEKLRNEGHRINQGRLGLGYQKEKPIKIYRAQTKPVKITRKSSANVHQVSVGQTLTEKKDTPKPVIIYTLKAAIAQARAYDSAMAPVEFEEGGQSTVDELKKVDLGTVEYPRTTFLSASLSSKEEVEYMSLLREYHDIFTWNYTEMPGLDPRVAVHKLAVHPSVWPVKQSQRRFRPKLVPETEKEVDKLIAANFIREVKYPSWIANIVHVKKKTGQIRVCVDFRDLNKACPKDNFLLPITKLMVDATTGHKDLSFMDGSSGYNQIRMDPKDEELTAFRTPKGIFCYKVMSFGLKNAGATYQRAMQNTFDDFLHKRVECYVDDLVVKTKQRADHLLDLRAVFKRL